MVKTSVGLPIQSLRLSRADLERLLAKLSGSPRRGADKKAQQRAHERRTAAGATMLLTLQPNGPPAQPACFAVPLWDISEGGLAFLHRSMIYRGTTCFMRIRSVKGKWLDASGDVVWCRHVEGIVHEVGVRFDALMDLGGIM